MFNSQEFKEAWNEWKQHKAEKHNMPYTDTAERKALASLFKMCDGQETVAISSIDYSIECNWAKIYLKTERNGTKPINGGNKSTGSQTRGTSTDRMEAANNW